MVQDTLENKSLPVYRIMEEFILEVNGYEVSKVDSSSVSVSLILTCVVNILFEKLTPQTGDWICKTPSAHSASGDGDFM